MSSYPTDQYGHIIGPNHTVVPIKVAGVTFKNGRRSRQTILKQIKWKEDPYQKIDGIDLVATEFEGEPAVEIWVYNKKSREMIGYVPKNEASYCHSRIDSFIGYHDFDVYGGGTSPDGSRKSYGAMFYARFSNDPDAIITPPDVAEKVEEKPFSMDEQHRKRAFDLFRQLYPNENGVSYYPITNTSRIAIMILKGHRKHYRTVIYDPEIDAIDCYDTKLNLLSTTRTRLPAKNKQTKSFLWLFIILVFIIAFLYFFQTK